MQMTVTFNNYRELREFIDKMYVAPGGAENGVPADTRTVPYTPAQNPLSVQEAPQFQQPQMQQTTQQQVNSVPVVPTTAVAQEFTQDQLAVAASGLVNAGKQQKLLTILQSFGANALTELPKERYPEFAFALRQEGAVI